MPAQLIFVQHGVVEVRSNFFHQLFGHLTHRISDFLLNIIGLLSNLSVQLFRIDQNIGQIAAAITQNQIVFFKDS